MPDDEFKAGRADIMKEVNSEKPKAYDIYADHVNAAYVSEQRFGFYTSFVDFAHINMIYKGQCVPCPSLALTLPALTCCTIIKQWGEACDER